VVAAIAALVWLYGNYNPGSHLLFPKCPFFVLTGLECPGCGSQRAIHHLLHLNIGQALQSNMLLVLSIPYLALGFWFEFAGTRGSPKAERIRTQMYGYRAIWVVLTVIVIFWVVRNLVQLS